MANKAYGTPISVEMKRGGNITLLASGRIYTDRQHYSYGGLHSKWYEVEDFELQWPNGGTVNLNLIKNAEQAENTYIETVTAR